MAMGSLQRNGEGKGRRYLPQRASDGALSLDEVGGLLVSGCWCSVVSRKPQSLPLGDVVSGGSQAWGQGHS